MTVIDWLFRDRESGDITIAQAPNAPALIATVATVACALTRSDSRRHAALDGLATAATTWWGLDEMARGANPFRRALGAVGLAAVVAHLVRRRRETSARTGSAPTGPDATTARPVVAG